MVYEVFISHEPCRFQIKKRLESPILSSILLRDKYLLHIINKIVSMIGPLRDLVYTYKYRETITIILNGET